MALALDVLPLGDAHIDSMPDCRFKYELIVKRAKDKGEKFTDK